MELSQITEPSGALQYIDFSICNETSEPLSLPFAEPTHLTCTIDALTDDLYHLLEYYVHNDAPLSCRVPTYPQSSSSDYTDETETALADKGKEAWTPLTIALQGTLQLSHIHIWTDINVLMHHSPLTPSSEDDESTTPPGAILAAAAYSIPPNQIVSPANKEQKNAIEGTKIIRSEPLTFTFHVAWIEGADVLALSSAASTMMAAKVSPIGIGFLNSLFWMLLVFAAAGVGAIGALQWERRGGANFVRRRGGFGLGSGGGGSMWKGQSLLGMDSKGNGASKGFGAGPGGIGASTSNGYGGYGGYGGYSSGMTGKRD